MAEQNASAIIDKVWGYGSIDNEVTRKQRRTKQAVSMPCSCLVWRYLPFFP